MLESNTEAKRTTGTGSKQGRKGRGVQLLSGNPHEGIGVRLSTTGDMLSLHPKELDTRGPLVDKGWHKGLSLCPPPDSPSLTPLNTHLCVSSGGAGD